VRKSSVLYLKKFDLPNAALFPFSRVSILVVAVKLASPKWNTSRFKKRVTLGNLHVKKNILILFTVLELYLDKT